MPTVQNHVVDVREAALANHANQLKGAYAARLTALLEGDDAAQARTQSDVDDLERRCLEHRRLRELARSPFRDTTYYLG